MLSTEDRNALQLVIPQSYQMKALQACHDDSRHMGLSECWICYGIYVIGLDDQGCRTSHNEV